MKRLPELLNLGLPPPMTDQAVASTARRFAISAEQFHKIAITALVLLITIMVTGAAVRLTESGLGCEDWPNCSSDRLIEFGTPNQAIEQINRLFTGLVSVSVLAAVVGARLRNPYRSDLWFWSWMLVAGVLLNIPLGGITVWTDLHPIAVGSHFVLALATVAAAMVLVSRSAQGSGPYRVTVSNRLLWHSRAVLLASVVLILSGPIVTGTGPHAGDATAQRYNFFLPDVVRVHAVLAWILCAVVVAYCISLVREKASHALLRRAQLLLALIVIQGGIGYLQWAMDLQQVIVLIHILFASLVCAAAVWMHMGLSAPVDESADLHAVPTPS